VLITLLFLLPRSVLTALLLLLPVYCAHSSLPSSPPLTLCSQPSFSSPLHYAQNPIIPSPPPNPLLCSQPCSPPPSAPHTVSTALLFLPLQCAHSTPPPPPTLYSLPYSFLSTLLSLLLCFHRSDIGEHCQWIPYLLWACYTTNA
jgi:hypothetical protein